MAAKSPFPGMDPYLERHWRDVHSRLVIYAADALQERLPDSLRARVEERVFVEGPTGTERAIYPDVRVVEHRPQPAATPTSTRTPVGVGIAEPLVVRVADEPTTQRFIEIVDAGSGNRVITVIEVVSLSNKVPGEAQALYRKKQQEVLAGKVNLVEIDLLRAGERVLSLASWHIPPSHRTAYQVVVRRGHRPVEAEVYRVALRERLPVIGVPLRQSDPDAALDLQELIDRCYRNGRYDGSIDYAAPPDPPLEGDDAAWAKGLVHSPGWSSPG